MQTEESILEATLHDEHIQSISDEEEEEAEETLSLCDLPLYSNQGVTEWEQDLSMENNDYFEFSQELDPCTISATLAPENIIFCGKLIPNRQPDIFGKDSSRLVETKKKKRGWSLFRSSTSSMEQVALKHDSSSLHKSRKKMYYKDKSGEEYDFPVHKVSILTSSSSGKARWYFYLFGISRFSTKVEWRDMKNRQSRRQFPSPPSSPILRFQNGGNEKVSRGRNGGWRLWGLIRALSCHGNHHEQTMEAASICYSPRKPRV